MQHRLVRAFLGYAAILTLITTSIVTAQNKKPNILVIFGDDIGKPTSAVIPTAWSAI